MGWMRIAGFVFVLGLLAACDLNAKTPNQCQTDDQCREGAYCDVGRALCVTACEKVGCLEGHFCDPDSHFCKDYCPHACPVPPPNATLLCGEVCVYACNDGFRECAGHAGACLSDSSDPTACGASCEESKVCAVPEYGTATCSDGVCGVACNAGFYDNAGSCKFCNVTEHCGANCTNCSATYQICHEGACITNPDRFVRNTSVIDQPTVLDATTKLIWQGCAAGLSGNDCKTGTATLMNWWDAADEDSAGNPDEGYCTKLTWGGYDDWRLPKEEAGAQELSSILLEKTSPCSTSPCIDAAAFPNTPASWFWSSSFYAYGPYAAWYVDFGNGTVYYAGKRSTGYVRCVRSGP